MTYTTLKGAYLEKTNIKLAEIDEDSLERANLKEGKHSRG